jgi:transposase InsO family protein
VILDAWRADYNNQRPHSSLGHLAPHTFRSASAYLPRFAAVQD